MLNSIWGRLRTGRNAERTTELILQRLERRLDGLEHAQADNTCRLIDVLGAIDHLKEREPPAEALQAAFAIVSNIERRMDGVQHALGDMAEQFGAILAIERRMDSVQHTLSDMAGQVSAILAIERRMDSVQHTVSDMAGQVSAILAHVRRLELDANDLLSDLINVVRGQARIIPLSIDIEAERSVAFDSPDHLEPRGTRNDNTRHPRFVHRCQALFEEIRHLDIGCAGGGLVWDFSLAGHIAIGVEGSDYNLKNRGAAWRLIPDRLFTADICYPFRLRQKDGNALRFNLVTAWELFEHIPTDMVDNAISNIVANMSTGGLLVCSIATFHDRDETTGTLYHQTVQPRGWWLEKFHAHGLEEEVGLFALADFVRGSGNPRAGDWNAGTNPEMGFHLALRYLKAP